MNSERAYPELVNDRPESTSLSNYSLDPSHARSTAIAAGDLRAGVLQEVTNILAANRANPLQAAKVGLERLQGNQLITTTEQRALGEICDALFALQRSKIGRDEALGKTRAIYKGLLADEESSPVALAIASMSASDASATVPNSQDPASEEQTALAARARFGGDIGMVGGAIAGAIVGGSIGGAGGAIIGAVIGGIAGSVAGACAD